MFQTEMSTFKWLNNLLLIENFLAIHRRYCDQSTIRKYFIIFQILVQTTFHTFLVIFHVHYLYQKTELSSELLFVSCCYSVSAYITAMSSIFTGIYYSCAFESYFKSICRVSENLEHDIRLTDSFKKIYWISGTMILFFIVFVIQRSVAVVIQYDLTVMLFVGLVLTSQSILRVTILFQYVMFFDVIMIVFILSKHFTSLISTIQKSVRHDITLGNRCGITKKQIKAWVELYRDLSNCCAKVTLCFGRQFFCSLILALIYYVMLIYQICYVNSNYNRAKSELQSIAITIGSYLTALMMPLFAGQKTKNQGVKFLRALVRLYNTTIAIDSNEAERKLIKDFIRLVKKNPIEVKLLSKIPAGMYLLPVIFTLAINYLIVMLQFMHVV